VEECDVEVCVRGSVCSWRCVFVDVCVSEVCSCWCVFVEISVSGSLCSPICVFVYVCVREGQCWYTCVLL